MSEDAVFVRVRSHRASDKLKRLLNVEKLDWYFNFWDGNNFVRIPADRLNDARQIKGITLARPTHHLHQCWSFV